MQCVCNDAIVVSNVIEDFCFQSPLLHILRSHDEFTDISLLYQIEKYGGKDWRSEGCLAGMAKKCSPCFKNPLLNNKRWIANRHFFSYLNNERHQTQEENDVLMVRPREQGIE